MTAQSISRLIELAKSITVSEQHKDEQRRSFVFGNTAFENSKITQEMVDKQAHVAA